MTLGNTEWGMWKWDWERTKRHIRFKWELTPKEIEMWIFYNRSPQPLGSNGWWWGRADVMIIEIKYTINGMCLNHPETIPNSLPSDPWKNCLPRTWSLAPKRLGTAVLGNSIRQYKMQVSFNAVLKNFNAKILCPSLLEDFFQGYSPSGTSCSLCFGEENPPSVPNKQPSPGNSEHWALGGRVGGCPGDSQLH